VSQQFAKIEMRRRLTLIGAMMIHQGDADGMLCGTFGTFALHREYIEQVIGLRKGASIYATMNAVLLPGRTVFIADTYVNADPTAAQVAEIATLCAAEIRRFGITPKVALLSHSSFGTSNHPSAQKMRDALALINAREPGLEVDGEMHGDAALSETVRRAAFPNSRLQGDANLLIMPTLDAANISFNLLKVAVGDRTPHRQHDRAHRRRLRDRSAGAAAVLTGNRNATWRKSASSRRLRKNAAHCGSASPAKPSRCW
jgi:malate dehydrogenase (oxaloacetate-decarboxylating)(NADP+)